MISGKRIGERSPSFGEGSLCFQQVKLAELTLRITNPRDARSFHRCGESRATGRSGGRARIRQLGLGARDRLLGLDHRHSSIGVGAILLCPSLADHRSAVVEEGEGNGDPDDCRGIVGLGEPTGARADRYIRDTLRACEAHLGISRVYGVGSG